MDDFKTLEDYREILAGWEEDLANAKTAFEAAIDAARQAMGSAMEAQRHIPYLKEKIAELERRVTA